ncbi:hypothetical protein HMPREF0297_0001 [Corynebacterium jeikeium ATCC 43734]|nr:hypothetical protein HMPREF0297_0001 [Corynebacterium jeikeium ATCC 43734]
MTPPLTTTDKPQQNKTHTQPNPTTGAYWCVVPFQTLHNRREHNLATIRNRLSNNHTTKVAFVLNIG